jgi:outer membrane protein assembly factor BamB
MIFTAGMAAAADWPTFRHDNARGGATAERLTLPLKQAWVARTPATPKSAWASEGQESRAFEGKFLMDRTRFDDALQVAIAGDRLYYGSQVDHAVYCRELSTGRELWRHVTGGPLRLAPTLHENRVYIGSDDGYVYCLAAADGRVVWKLHAAAPDDWLLARGQMISRWPVRTGVLVEDGVAYFGAGIFPHENIYLYAVDAASGKVIWKRDDISERDAGRDDLSPQGYLLAEGSRLFVPSGRTLPAALDRLTGKVLHKRTHAWRSDAGGDIGGWRAMLADGQIYTGGSHHYLAMQQDDGDVGFGWFDGEQLAIADEAAFALTGEAIRRLDRQAYAEASREIHKLQLKSSSLSKQLSGAGKKAEEIQAAINETRQKIRDMASEGVTWSTPEDADQELVVTGNLVIAGGHGEVVAYDIQSGKEAWNFAVDGDARGLAVAGGHLIVSTNAGHVYAFAADNLPAAKDLVQRPLDKSPYPQDDLTSMYQAAAADILARTDMKQGFCLVLGSENGRLAYEMSKLTDLTIVCVEPDAKKVEASRKALSAAGLYGHRVIVHQADPAAIPYSDYFANLIVSDSLLLTGKVPGDPEQIARHLKPCGGVVCFGKPETSDGPRATTDELTSWLEGMKLTGQGAIQTDLPYVKLTRGKLPGAGSWSHQYGEPGNTAVSDDKRVQGSLGVLWYGDPGPGKMVNRHDGAVGPVSANGRLFIQGNDSVMAYDAYNGQFLWETQNPKALRTGVFRNENPGNLAATDDRLFMLMGDKCYEYDAATGKIVATHGLPASKKGDEYQWGYIAVQDNRLYGTATLRDYVEERLRRRGKATNDHTDMLFAIDLANGEHLWSHQGQNISHHTIALGGGRVYLIDSSLTSQQRTELLRQDKSELAKLTGEEARIAEERMKNIDMRLAMALDAAKGDVIWSRPVDVTDCREIGIGGGKLTLMHKDGVLVLCGANANGHYWKQFLEGEFSRRRLVALSADDGQKLWSKDANYRHRPIIVGEQIVAEPWSFALRTGEQRMREHPLTGQQVPWSIIRPGHHCGMISGCENMLLFRSGFTGFYDLKADDGTQHIAGHRPGCWINAIPANGLVMIPEASAGCVCLFSIASTVVMEPRAPRNPWTIYSSTGATTPVEHMALNFGAPGDRRDARGTVWLAYPRPSTSKVTGLDLSLKLDTKFAERGGYAFVSADRPAVEGAESPWIFSSHARGLTRCSIPLLGKGDGPATYRVKLLFAETDDQVQAGGRVFDVKLQGKTVLENVDIVKSAGGVGKAVELTIDNVAVSDDLLLELISNGKQQTAICGLEIQRQSPR